MVDEKNIENQFNVLFDDITEDLENKGAEEPAFTENLDEKAKNVADGAAEAYAEEITENCEDTFSEVLGNAEEAAVKDVNEAVEISENISEAVAETVEPAESADPEEFFEELSLEDDQKAEERYSMDVSEEENLPGDPNPDDEDRGDKEKNFSSREDEDRKKENRRFWIFTAIIGLLVVAVILAILYFRGFIFQKDPEPTVPSSEIVTEPSSDDSTSASPEETESTDETESTVESKEDDTSAVLEHYTKLFVINDKAETDTVIVRKSASKESEKVGIIAKFGGGEIIEKSGDWYHVKSGGLEGYIYADFVAVEDEAKELALKNTKKYVKAKVENTLNIRTAPSTDGEVVGSVLNGGVMDYSGEEEGFYRVSFAERYEGYVSKDFSEYDYFLMEAVPYTEE